LGISSPDLHLHSVCLAERSQGGGTHNKEGLSEYELLSKTQDVQLLESD